MDSYRITATELKRNTAEVLSRVIYERVEMVIEKFGRPVVKVVPVDKKINQDKEPAKVFKRTFGSLPDFPDIVKMRVSRKHDYSL